MPSALDFRIISIGTLGAHPLWDERQPVRTGHATTTLIRSGDMTVIVDPGLPAPALKARLHERSGLTPKRRSPMSISPASTPRRAGESSSSRTRTG